jgi:hypothetical protein
MTLPESLGLSADQWQFLANPKKYIDASKRRSWRVRGGSS